MMVQYNNNMPFCRKTLQKRINQSQWRWRLSHFVITSGKHTLTNAYSCTHPDHNRSAAAVFSLHSDQDPSGLLLLPPKGAPSDFDISPILSVMETLLLVATREVRPLSHTQCLNCFIMLFTIYEQPAPCLHILMWNHMFLLFWCSSLFNCLPSVSVRLWWWMRVVEPAGQCCCPCSGLCRVACSPGATCSSKEEPPPLLLWSWPETSC